jgi:LysM repeat protein
MRLPHRIIGIVLTIVLPLSILYGQNGSNISVEEYISTYKDLAIDDMKKYGIPASIKLAQGILESGSGNSELAKKANNHFGIKCHKGWTGKTFRMDDDKKNECFRKYRDPKDSYRDHSVFLTTRDRYSGLFELQTDDYRGWAYGLKAAGYATNPRYPELLIRIIEENRLYQYDSGSGGVKSLAANEVKNGGEAEAIYEEALTFSELFKDKAAVETSRAGRKVFENNGVKFIFIEEGDTYFSLAEEFEIYAWQLWKYNELSRKVPLKTGNILYLEKKRRKAEKDIKQHVVKPGESMIYISQVYGVRLKRLYKMNDISKGMEPSVGEALRLR